MTSLVSPSNSPNIPDARLTEARRPNFYNNIFGNVEQIEELLKEDPTVVENDFFDIFERDIASLFSVYESDNVDKTDKRWTDLQKLSDRLASARAEKAAKVAGPIIGQRPLPLPPSLREFVTPPSSPARGHSYSSDILRAPPSSPECHVAIQTDAPCKEAREIAIQAEPIIPPPSPEAQAVTIQTEEDSQQEKAALSFEMTDLVEEEIQEEKQPARKRKSHSRPIFGSPRPNTAYGEGLGRRRRRKSTASTCKASPRKGSPKKD